MYSFSQNHANYDNFWHPAKPGEKALNAEFVYWAMNDYFNPKFHDTIYNSLKVFGYLILLVCAYYRFR